MFGNMSQIASLLRNAGQIKQNMQEMQERLKTARHEGEAGAGQVCATVDGRGELVALRIDPQLVSGGDVEMIEDLVVAAVRDAVARSREALQEEMRAATGGMDLSGMMGEMLGGS